MIDFSLKNKLVLDWILLILFLISAITISFSFYQEHIENIAPCNLCKWQRLVYTSVFFISPIGLIQQFNYICRKVISLLLFAGFVLSSYHALVQFGWLTDRCTITPNVETINDFMMMLENPTPPCSTIGWKLLGLSASIYSTFFTICALLFINFPNLLKLRSICHLILKKPQ